MSASPRLPLPLSLSLVLPLLACLSSAATAQDEEPADASRIEALERRLEELERRLEGEGEGSTRDAPLEDSGGEDEKDWKPILQRALGSGIANPHSWLQKFNLTGYGEFHANLTEGGTGGDKYDIHRLVLGVGYSFNSWISLTSEVEIEHGFVADDNGELVIEQAFIDLRFYRAFSVRVGRVLTPLGIYNQWHDPPSFPGVERPSFAQVIIPSTWSSDGAGIFGNPLPWLRYEAYVVGSIDGSKVSPLNGIRSGRIKERPSLHEIAFTGRVDLFPFASMDPGLEQSLRIGVSAFVGGLDNGDNGKDPGAGSGNRLEIYSADLSYSIWRFTVRGAIAYEHIDGALDIGGGAPTAILGMYAEMWVRLFPEAWREGFFSKTDVLVFFRYDDINTQYRVPGGVVENDAGNRQEYTLGVAVQLLPNLVFKAEYQIRDDATTNNLPDLLNLGVGFQF